MSNQENIETTDQKKLEFWRFAQSHDQIQEEYRLTKEVFDKLQFVQIGFVNTLHELKKTYSNTLEQDQFGSNLRKAYFYMVILKSVFEKPNQRADSKQRLVSKFVGIIKELYQKSLPLINTTQSDVQNKINIFKRFQQNHVQQLLEIKKTGEKHKEQIIEHQKKIEELNLTISQKGIQQDLPGTSNEKKEIQSQISQMEDKILEAQNTQTLILNEILSQARSNDIPVSQSQNYASDVINNANQKNSQLIQLVGQSILKNSELAEYYQNIQVLKEKFEKLKGEQDVVNFDSSQLSREIGVLRDIILKEQANIESNQYCLEKMQHFSVESLIQEQEQQASSFQTLFEQIQTILKNIIEATLVPLLNQANPQLDQTQVLSTTESFKQSYETYLKVFITENNLLNV